MITRLAKVLRLARDRHHPGRKNRNKKKGEHRLSIETLEPRMLLAATVLSQAIASQAVVSQEYAPAAVVAAPADFDNDGDVDGNDLAQWEDNFGADADSDGDTDGADFLAWQRQFTGSLYTLFSDDFSNDTIVNYTTQTTDGAGGSLLYDATNQRAQVTTGDNNGMMFSQGVTATDSGTFSIDFNPTMLHPAGGVLQVRLRQDANNYYEISNTDGYAVGAIRKFVNNVEEDIASFTSNYSQNNNYTITVDFSPTETTVTAFDDVLMINTDGTAINVNSFEANSYQQDSFFDNISLTSGSVAPDTEKPSPPTGLGATVVSSSQIDLAWTASTDNVGVTRYTVYRNGVQIPTNVVTTSYQDTGLAGSTTYSYTVKAFDAAGNTSAQSVAAVATTLAGSGTTYYVDDDNGGSNNNIGTAAAPFRTIQYGVDQLIAGDTLIVKDGTYTSSSGNSYVAVNIGVSGTASKWITIKSETKWGAVLDGQSHFVRYGFNFLGNVDYVRIEDFEIKDYYFTAIHMNQPGISNIYIYGNHIHGIGQVNDPGLMMGAIDTFGAGQGGTVPDEALSTQFVTIDSNIIHDIGKLSGEGIGLVHDHGLYLRGRNTTVINNIFYNIKAGWAISSTDQNFNPDSGDNYDYIANNIIYADNGDYSSSRYPQFGGILVRANYVWVENNIIIVPTGKEHIGGAIDVFKSGVPETNLVFRNNLTNANNIWAGHYSHITQAVDVVESDNKVNQDPGALFVGNSLPTSNAADYQLKVGSPAIDVGKIPVLPNLSGGLAYDYRHTAIRPQGSAYDIGAFEFVPPAPLLAPEGEELGEVSPAVQGELFDVALGELIGSSRDEAPTQLQLSAPRQVQSLDIEPSVELAERFAINHRTGPAAPALRLSGDHNLGNNTRDLEPTESNREDVFDSLFTEFEGALIR